MSTNYYAYVSACKCCGNPQEKLHIGKYSNGWVFTFQVYPHKGLMGYVDWVGYLNKSNVQIRDEHGKLVKHSRFVNLLKSASPKDNGLKYDSGSRDSIGYPIIFGDFT